MHIHSIALLLMTVATLAAEPGNSEAALGSRNVRLRFPPHADLTGLQISYFITGSFGGYGGRLPATAETREYRIETVHDHQPAKTFKAIVWCPGYEMVLLSMPSLPEGSAEAPTIKLNRSKWVPLSGRLISATNTPSVDIEAMYFAPWSHAFFGIADGPILQILVSATQVAAGGTFELRIPDFARDPAVASLADGPERGVLRLTARSVGAEYSRYDLEEVRKPGRRVEWTVSTEYPTNLLLALRPRPTNPSLQPGPPRQVPNPPDPGE